MINLWGSFINIDSIRGRTSAGEEQRTKNIYSDLAFSITRFIHNK
jgi:hypothetical protein